MAMAFLEEEADENVYNEVLLAAVDAAVAKRLGTVRQPQPQQRNQQHQHQVLHPRPPVNSAAPQEKLIITHLTSPASEDIRPLPLASRPPPPPAQRNQYALGMKTDVVVVTKAPPHISSKNNQQSFPNVHREGFNSSRVGSVGFRDLKPQGGVMKNAAGGKPCSWNGVENADEKIPNGYWKGGGGRMVSSGGRGGDGKQEMSFVGYAKCDVKQEVGFVGYGKCENRGSGRGEIGRRPLEELQPWNRSHHEIAERPSGNNDWVEPAEKMRSSEPKDCNGTGWFSGMSGSLLFKECQEAAMRTLMPGDYTVLNGKPFIKKTGWRKIAFFFNVSFEIKDKSIQFDPEARVLRAEFVVRASLPSGRFTDSWGSCDRGEKRFNKPNHDIPSTAETRAKTRACQDLLGIGEYKLDGSQ